RFALARALVWKPKLLIIDEPLANLDIITQDVFLKDLRNLADSLSYPMSVLISSQHLHEVEVLADRILFLKEGAIKFNASKKLLGQNRSYNTFELTISCDEEMLREHMRQLSPQEIRHSGITHIVTLPLSVTGNRLLQHLLDRGVEIRYFRDISCSIKPLFDETNASN
ncbi:MAG: ABC transporter ATP-binding protein, partial [Candidatus Electrothrix sp. AUS1_2]|nr:ABC transporter ATP-binding protein [Candidatus Electrothrix sp. AUS1_2]